MGLLLIETSVSDAPKELNVTKLECARILRGHSIKLVWTISRLSIGPGLNCSVTNH
jgi:hypothetical protein